MPPLPDWATAHGGPLLAVRLREQVADFQVDEHCSVALTGSGEHAWLHVEKTDANTQWVAAQLAQFAGVREVDIGYAGRKDRRAVTRQWFSVRCPETTVWSDFACTGVAILEQRRHSRKLRLGTHQGNRFRLALRASAIDTHRERLDARLAVIAAAGVPNYFGEQRFGRGGQNISMSRRLFAGQRLSRNKRSIALSAARSLIFNAILDRRVQDGSWNRLLPGEVASLAGSNSVFPVAAVTAELESRCAAQDIHPSGSLWGVGAPLGDAEVAELEADLVTDYPDFCAGLLRHQLAAASRPLRLPVKDLRWQYDDDALWLEFALGKGGFATAVVRELANHV